MTRKNALGAADVLNDKVLPFYQDQEIDLLRILTTEGFAGAVVAAGVFFPIMFLQCSLLPI